jgi:hypothetical protein
VFGASVIFMVLTVLLTIATERRPQSGAAASDARLMHS